MGLGFTLHKNCNNFKNKQGFSHDIPWVSLGGKMTTCTLENWGIIFLKCLPTYYAFIRLLGTTLNKLCMFLLMLDGYQKKLVFVGSIFHKIIYKRFWFHFLLCFKIMHRNKVSIFWKFGSFFTMLILINLKTISYHLRFSQTGYY
jgi:hypothetical protein